MPVKIAALLAVVIYLTSCSASKDAPKGGTYFEFTDDLNNTVVLKEKPKSVVSAMGSYCEMWILSGGELVGATDDAVSERGMELDKAQIIGTVKDPNVELILSLSPDFVILSTDVETHIKLAKTLTSAGIAHAYFKEDSYSDYLRILKLFTQITDNPDLYDQYGTPVQEQIDEVLARVGARQESPKVLLIRSMSTKAKALKSDHMVGTMLSDIGVDNIAERHESLLEDLSMETIIDENPDFIFVVIMGKVDAAIATLENGIMANPAWNNLAAVKNNNYHVLPKDLFQYKPNARWGESYEYLEKILYK